MHFMRMIERTLKRLRTDYLDLYYWHAPDPSTPIDQTLRAMDDLVRQGKIRYFALSNFPAWQMTEIVMTSKDAGAVRAGGDPDAVQHGRPCHRGRRSSPPVGASALASHAIARWPGACSPGWIPSKQEPSPRSGTGDGCMDRGPGSMPMRITPPGSWMPWRRRWELPPAQLALGWLLSRPAVTSAVIGPENLEELEQNASAGDLRLTREQLDILEPIGAKVSI